MDAMPLGRSFRNGARYAMQMLEIGIGMLKIGMGMLKIGMGMLEIGMGILNDLLRSLFLAPLLSLTCSIAVSLCRCLS